MRRIDVVASLLEEIEHALRAARIWDVARPSETALVSGEAFGARRAELWCAEPPQANSGPDSGCSLPRQMPRRKLGGTGGSRRM